MSEHLICPLGRGAATAAAASRLTAMGERLSSVPCQATTHILLDIPAFSKGLPPDLEEALSAAPEAAIVGGGLSHPLLEGRRKLDLLTREDFLAPNAAITAHCALTFLLPLLKTALPDTPTLVLGWGRIGKTLARLLKNLSCPVTIAPHKPADAALARALGYEAALPHRLSPGDFSLVLNTVPKAVYEKEALARCQNTIFIDLASAPGLGFEKAHIARGLPGKLAPESAGKLIAQTLYQWIREESL